MLRINLNKLKCLCSIGTEAAKLLDKRRDISFPLPLNKLTISYKKKPIKYLNNSEQDLPGVNIECDFWILIFFLAKLCSDVWMFGGNMCSVTWYRSNTYKMGLNVISNTVIFKLCCAAIIICHVFHGSLSPVCFCCFGFKWEGERERERIQALEDIQTTNLFLVVEPLLVAVSAWDW